ncbi:YhgE/Pip domain-containing protein [Sphaerotilus sp.]|uniref:YhgE/Pip domain-containing protein n=1 Tax=Sphaerotilus sp. TaxID=2093942 RepID=UPI0034E1F09F
MNHNNRPGRTGWWSGVNMLMHADWTLLVRDRRFAIAVVGALFIPALYALIYLSSMWDPSARTSALRAGLVNADMGGIFRGQTTHMGEDVSQTLLRQGLFQWQRFEDAESAKQAVRRGELSFAVLIPPNFSELAVPGREAGAAKLVIYTSEGNSYSGAGFAKRFAPELAHRVNEALNEQRWDMVLTTAQGSKLNLATLRDRVGHLHDGSRLLAEGTHQARQGAAELSLGLGKAGEAAQQVQRGTTQLADASTQFAGGWRQLSSGLRTLDSHRPAATDLDPLKSGSQRLLQGQTDLGKGLEQLYQGTRQLKAGTQALQRSTQPIPLIGDGLAEGARAIDDGVELLGLGLVQARDGNQRLIGGMQQLQTGIQSVSGSFLQFSGALHQITTALPDDSRVDALPHGAQQLGSGALALGDGLRKLQSGHTQLHAGLTRLESGSAQLRDGLALLASALPGDVPLPEGSARGLADSVEPALEIVAPVGNDGAGFAPNFVPMSLWVGAVTAALLFNLRRLPDTAAGLRRSAQVMGKLVWPATVVLGQSAVMVAMMMGILHIRVHDLGPFVVTVAAASLAFLFILFALIRWFGELGKVLGIILLIVQLSSAGATLPIELATPFFQALHPYLPFTWVVRAFRASMFGAYDGQWMAHWAVVAGCGGAALLSATLAGRWKIIPAADYHPGIEID